MSDDELFYLQPGFDLNSLTMASLRKILVAQDVPYPSSAKKAELVQIVSDEVLPKAQRLLSARARTKRTSKGITDAPNIQDDGEDEEELMPPPPAQKTPRSRKSKSNLTVEDTVASTLSTSRRSRTPSTRKSTTKHARESDTEGDAEKAKPSARKTRKSVPATTPVAPSIKIEEPDLQLKRESREAGESPFTDDNPFQSGSSPSSGPRRVSSTSRTRKSVSGSRRKTASPSAVRHQDNVSAPSRTTFEFSVANLRQRQAGSDKVETTEEFTPDAARELEQENQLVPKRPSNLARRRKQPASRAARTAPWAILIMVLAGIGTWYRQEKINIGYCGVGAPEWSLASNPHIPAWIHENLQPACEPCPQHSFCYPNMEVKCEEDFVLRHHPLSFNGLLPLPPTCEPDSEKARRVRAVADRAIEELRERRAAYECGDEIRSVPQSPSHVEEEGRGTVNDGDHKLEIPEEALRQEVSKMRRKGMSQAEFDDLWRGALNEIMGRDEVEVVRDGYVSTPSAPSPASWVRVVASLLLPTSDLRDSLTNQYSSVGFHRSGRVLLSSTSLARLPLGCAIRRSLLRTLSRNRGTLSVLVLIISAVFYVRNRIIGYQQASAQIPTLVATTLDRVATQAVLKEQGLTSEGFISVGQLRDDVLRGVFSPQERERVWKGVSSVVEGNSNIRAATREGGRTGEWSRVWEWIGPLNLVSGFEGRASGGVASGAPSPAVADRSSPPVSEPVESRNWDEGRPIY